MPHIFQNNVVSVTEYSTYDQKIEKVYGTQGIWKDFVIIKKSKPLSNLELKSKFNGRKPK